MSAVPLLRRPSRPLARHPTRQAALALVLLMWPGWPVWPGVTDPSPPAAVSLPEATRWPDGFPAAGRWPLWPRPGVVAGFDPPEHPYDAGHRGVDLAGRPGQPVHAALAGQVTYAGALAGRGVVVVDHGAVRTTYEPVEAMVSVGDHVHAGQVVGTLGLVGSHCLPSPCLHWGLLRGREYLDPLTLLGLQRVRLLPWEGAGQARGWAWR